MMPRPSPTAREVEACVIRVLLVHDHALVRAGLRMLIESQDGFSVVGQTDNYPEAITLATERQPDVILFDHAIGYEDGLEHIPVLLKASSRSKVLILTSTSDSQFCQHAVRFGAMGLISKDEEPRLLLKAIQKVSDGEAWIDRVTMGRLIAAMPRHSMSAAKKEASMPEHIDSLTKRERDIIRLVSQGLKNKQIAGRLSISDVTVRHHLTSTFDKLGVKDRFELMIYAYKHGLSDLPS